LHLDFKEQGKRKLLNFGHTLAHALESVTQYQRYYHGEAVAIGMCVATSLSGLENGVLDRLLALLNAVGLPTRIPEFISVDALWDYIIRDKKHSQNHWHWILLHDLGQAYVAQDMLKSQIISILKAYGATAKGAQ